VIIKFHYLIELVIDVKINNKMVLKYVIDVNLLYLIQNMMFVMIVILIINLLIDLMEIDLLENDYFYINNNIYIKIIFFCYIYV